MAPDEPNIVVEAGPTETHSSEGPQEPVQSKSDPITHPYRALLSDTSFARCHQIATPPGRAESFCRSIYMLGNGFPLFEPAGILPMKKGSPPKVGLSIGDIGFLNQDGCFEYHFNIFKPPSDPMQSPCPPDMVPFPSSPGPNDVLSVQVPPGTIFTTKGVEVLKRSSSPLDISFTIKAREAAIIIYPNGAAREDLVSTADLRDYVQTHALKWYQFLNAHRNGPVTCPNGCLYIITGCDKADTWATACYPQGYDTVGIAASARFQENKDDVWEENKNVSCEYKTSADSPEMDTLFIRGMKIAINVSDWTKHVLHNVPPHEIAFYNVLTVPVLGLRAKIQTLLERWQNHPERFTSEPTDLIFHPLDIILRYLVEEFPTSNVAIVEDAVWASIADPEADSDTSSIARLLVSILETHVTANEGGWVTLEPAETGPSRGSAKNNSGTFFAIPQVMKEKYRQRHRRQYLSRRISGIFPGPPIPIEQLENDP